MLKEQDAHQFGSGGWGTVIKEAYLEKKAPEMIPEGWLDFYSWQ